jgi:cell wall-associated NlpC family hydrolase
VITDLDREHVLRIADKWLRTPYHHKQAVLGAGVDCALFLYAVYVEAGLIPAFEFDDYPPDWMMHRSEERYLSHVMDYAYQVDAPLPADVVMYKFGRCFSHGAIVRDYPNIIHSTNGIGVTYARIDEGRLGGGRERTYWRIK